MKLRIEDIKVGMTIYTACSEQGWVTESTVLLDPYIKYDRPDWGPWVIATDPGAEENVLINRVDNYEKSLKDMGVVRNDYNKHLTFDNKTEAEKYAGIFKCPTCGQRVKQ